MTALTSCTWYVTMEPQPGALAVRPEEVRVEVPEAVLLWAREAWRLGEEWSQAYLLVTTERGYCGMTGEFDSMEGALTADEAMIVHTGISLKGTS